MKPDWNLIRDKERARFETANPKAGARFAATSSLEPAGNSRHTVFQDPYPPVFAEGLGCRVVDIDGNVRVDFVNNYTSLALGHADGEVVRSVAEAASRGTAFAGPNEEEYALAAVLLSRMPNLELVRFFTTGSEATAAAMRLARAHTDRDLVVRCQGAYHGSHDYSMGPGRGIPSQVSATILETPFNKIGPLKELFTNVGDRIAAFIVEPIQGTAGMFVASKEFLQSARALCDAFGAVLIFDEVMSLRASYGGMQQVLETVPDLTTMGKIIGGGLPLSAVAGRADLIELLDPRRDGVQLSGTFNANPLACAAGRVTLERLTPDTITRLNELGEVARNLVADAMTAAGVDGSVTGYGSLLNVHLVADAEIADATEIAETAPARRALALAVLNRGYVVAGRGLVCISTPTSRKEIEGLAEAIYDVLAAGRAASNIELFSESRA